MTKEVYIRLKNGDKEAEMKINAIDDEHQLAVVDGMLKFFNIDVDFKELAEIYKRSGKAYQEFYQKMDSEADYKTEESKEVVNPETYANDLKENVHYVTGIKFDDAGRALYKCRYRCDCGNESNHYIRVGTKTVTCWDCKRILKVKPATNNGEPKSIEDCEKHRDLNGNFYVAGKLEPKNY